MTVKHQAKALLPIGLLLIAGCAVDAVDVSAESQDMTSYSCTDRYEREAPTGDNGTMSNATGLHSMDDGDLEVHWTGMGASLADVDEVDWFRWNAWDVTTDRLAPLVRISAYPAFHAIYAQEHFERRFIRHRDLCDQRH